MNSTKGVDKVNSKLIEIESYVGCNKVTSVSNLIKILKGDTLIYSYLTKNYILHKHKGVYLMDKGTMSTRNIAIDTYCYILTYRKQRHEKYIKKFNKSRTT